jgi:hypothetical protein
VIVTMSLPYYPVNETGPFIKGMLIGGLGIVHVFLAQFAIGGGALMCYFQWLAQSGREPNARRFLDSYFRTLVLVSFVVGALTGVGMWFTTIQVSPRTIGLMVHHFHWVWAIEWTFFCVEIVAGYVFYRYGKDLPDRERMKLLILYTIASWFSLFWINGILSWQLTPGRWTMTPGVWAGFFNPSFWPSLVFRTIVATTLGALAACVVINTIASLDREARAPLIHRAAHLLVPMALMPFVGAWFLWSIPPDSRSWATGGSIAMTMFLGIAVAASILIGGYAFVGLLRQRLTINGATATLLVALAFGATAGGEFVREGVRKPYTIRETLYSNSIRPEEVRELRRVGCVTNDPYPLRDAGRLPNEQVRRGMKVFRFQCSVCHTLEGMNGLTHLTGSWSVDQARLNVAKLQQTKPFMPPFAGSAGDVEALVQLLEWVKAGEPAAWSTSTDSSTIATIDRWLEEAGPAATPSGASETTARPSVTPR